jgi:hypothetical protein
MKKCNEFKKALPGLAKGAGVDITASCVLGSSDEDCMKKIKDNVADFITLNGGKIYEAGELLTRSRIFSFHFSSYLLVFIGI